MSTWTSDDLFFLEAAYMSGMSLPDTARMLRKPEDEVRSKAAEEGFIDSPSTVPDVEMQKLQQL
jgi:hypothetical protein